MKKTQASSLCLIVAGISLGGFLVENVWLALTKGYMNNRNMVLPFLLGYGLAVLAIYAMFGTPTAPRIFAYVIRSRRMWVRVTIYFLLVCTCVMLGECALGLLVEKTCGIIWWNYERLPLNLTKYTSVPTTLGFATLISAFIQFLFPPLFRMFSKMNPKVLYMLATVISVLLVADFLHSGIRMFCTQEIMHLWRVDLR